MAVEPVKCRRCKRKLKLAETAARGIGPVCEEKEAWEQDRPVRPRPRRRAARHSGPDLLDLLKEVESGQASAE